VLYSHGHNFGTPLGETGCDAFGIMKPMGHSSITVSQRYVHPSEAPELAFGRMIEGNVQVLGTISGTAREGFRISRRSSVGRASDL
jgi:hypothetical protein